MYTRSQDEQLGDGEKADQYSYLNDPYYSSDEYKQACERSARNIAEILATPREEVK